MGRGGGEPAQRVLDDARALDEILCTERRREARRARGWEDVVGTRDVVADHLGGVAAHEDRSRVADARHERRWDAHHQLEVLRRQAVGQLDRVVERRPADHRAVGLECPRGDLAPRQRGALARGAARTIAGSTRPPGPAGVTSTISRTPATRAGTAVINTVDGYAARPPGA